MLSTTALDATVAAALNVTGDPVSPAAVAEACCCPCSGPSVNWAAASPSELVLDEPGETAPPPWTTAQETMTPGAALPSASVTCTRSESGNTLLTRPA